MNVHQLAAAFRQMGTKSQGCMGLYRVVDMAAPTTDALAAALMGYGQRAAVSTINKEQFRNIFEVATMPWIPKFKIFEEGFEYTREVLHHFLTATNVRGRQNPAAAYYEDDVEVLGTIKPNGCRRALGVFNPWNTCFSMFIFPPQWFCFWLHAVFFIGYPVNYCLCRPCFLYLAAQARSLTLRESSLVIENTGHPGYTFCSGPLGFCFPCTCFCTVWAYLCFKPGACKNCRLTCGDWGHGGDTLAMNGSPHLFSPHCLRPMFPETYVIPLEIITDAIVVDRSGFAGWCNPFQAELAGLSTLAIIGPSDSIIAAVDAVPHSEAITFVDTLKAAQIPRPMDPQTAADFTVSMQASWIGLYAAIHTAILPEAVLIDEQPNSRRSPRQVFHQIAPLEVVSS